MEVFVDHSVSAELPDCEDRSRDTIWLFISFLNPFTRRSKQKEVRQVKLFEMFKFAKKFDVFLMITGLGAG
jgi:hypothetical protein